MSKEFYADRKLIYKEEDINLDDIKIKRVPRVDHLIDTLRKIYEESHPPTVEQLQDLDERFPGERFLYEVGERDFTYSDTFVNNLLKEQYLNRIKECKHM